MDINIASWNYDSINSNLGKLWRKGERSSFQFWLCPVSKFCFPTFKPLLLQSAAQDSLPKRVQNQVHFRYVKLQQCSNSAHVLKETNGLVKSRCSIHSAVSGGHWCRAASRGMTPGFHHSATFAVCKVRQLQLLRDEAGEREITLPNT